MNEPIIVQVSPRRYLVVMLRTAGVTGGTCHGTDYRYGEVMFGPADWWSCCDWIANRGKGAGRQQ